MLILKALVLSKTNNQHKQLTYRLDGERLRIMKTVYKYPTLTEVYNQLRSCNLNAETRIDLKIQLNKMLCVLQEAGIIGNNECLEIMREFD